VASYALDKTGTWGCNRLFYPTYYLRGWIGDRDVAVEAREAHEERLYAHDDTLSTPDPHDVSHLHQRRTQHGQFDEDELRSASNKTTLDAMTNAATCDSTAALNVSDF